MARRMPISRVRSVTDTRHDVHDTDASDQKADRSHGTKQGGHGFGGGGEHGGKLLGVHDPEIVLFIIR